MVSGSDNARTMRTGDDSLVGEAEAKAGVWPAAEAKTTERQEAGTKVGCQSPRVEISPEPNTEYSQQGDPTQTWGGPE